MNIELSNLMTEKRNPKSLDLDQKDTMEILEIINNEDKHVAFAVDSVLSQVEKAVEIISAALSNYGRLFYVGAGTSGRLGVLDASECPPTFMTSKDLVQTVMAGGSDAFFSAAEGVEDEESQGQADIKKIDLTDKDVVVGITASGRTPYPIGALKYAQSLGAATVSLSCNEDSLISNASDCAIEVIVGPEVLTGSTRMKAATAHKMILNMISTATMIKLGKVYGNLMVDVHASNLKLKERAKQTVQEATHVSYEAAQKTLEQTNYQVKPAIVMIEADASYDKAKEAILHMNGYVRAAIDYFHS